MPITKDPVTGMFWEETPVPPKRASFAPFDILPEGLALLDQAVDLKVKWDAYVDKVRVCEALGFDPEISIEKLNGTFTENVRDIFKAKIKGE